MTAASIVCLGEDNQYTILADITLHGMIIGMKRSTTYRQIGETLSIQSLIMVIGVQNVQSALVQIPVSLSARTVSYRHLVSFSYHIQKIMIILGSVAIFPMSEATTSGLHSTVSWQSAFWALVPLAMNSMTQPAGRWFGVHSPEMSFALRSSPVFCACDALHAMFYLAWHTFQAKSLRSALEKTARRRFRDATFNDRETGLALPHSVKCFRIALFSLGALPQLIKLLSVHGLKWTTTWGILFAASFCILEVLSYMAKDIVPAAVIADQQENPYDPYESGLEFYLAHTAGLANTVLRVSFNTLVAHHIIELIVLDTWPYLLGLATLALATILSTTFPRGEQLSAPKALIRMPMHAIFAISLGLFAHLSADAQSTKSGVKFWSDILAMTFLALGLFGSLLHWYFMMGVQRRARYVEEGVYIYFVFCNALTALLYYALVYDPSGTYKPIWTNQLG